MCDKRVPQVVLSPKKNKSVCNLCDSILYLKTYCSDVMTDEEKSLRLLEITESQLKHMIIEIRKKIKGKSYQVDQINEYWALKTNDKYFLSDTGKKSIEKFLLDFTIEEIQECIDIAFNKVTVDDEGKFKYLCGILNGKLKERNHSLEYSEVLKYWNYKRPQNWKKADEGKIEHVISKHEVTKIKYYIDCSVDEDRGWADFDSLITALDEDRFN
ncbi:MAG: hypothetical protein HYZ42_06295 [Bacteroidetes bacterium]|nr:hypothetical protein [Bacteroidota bacterium]